MRGRARVAVALLVASLAGAAAAHAQTSEAESRARAHYEVGLGMYHLGNYHDAIREFSAGYELSPRPEFLINLGQAYRKLGNFGQARQMFQRYLAHSPADATDRAQVQALLAEVEHAAAAAGKPTSPSGAPSVNEPPGRPPTTPPSTPPSTPPVTPSLPPPSTTAAPSTVAANPTLVAAPAPHRSAWRRYWWTVPVGAVLVGTAVGLAVYFSLPPSQVSCTSATVGCIDLRH
jgi:Tfp pilus assembly protein PilF